MLNENATIEELEAFFSTYELPKEIQLNPGERITNVRSFVDSQVKTYKHNRSSKVFDVFLLRLIHLRELLLKNKEKGPQP